MAHFILEQFLLKPTKFDKNITKFLVKPKSCLFFYANTFYLDEKCASYYVQKDAVLLSKEPDFQERILCDATYKMHSFQLIMTNKRIAL